MKTAAPRQLTRAGGSLFVLCAALLGYRFANGGRERQHEMATVRRGELTRQVSATGSVQCAVSVEIRSQISGTVRTVLAERNEEVRRGQILAEIDPSSYEVELDRARGSLLEARVLVAKAEVELEEAQRRLDRSMRLFEAGTLSRIDLEAAQYSHRLAALEREALRAQFTQREAAVRAAKIDLAHCRITAPLDGIVLSREVEPGGFVDVAARYSSAPFVIATDPTQVQLELDVAEADIGSVSVGQKVVFTVDAHPGTAFDGTITQVRIGSTLKQQAVYYKIEAEVANSELLLRPGMTVDAKITTGDRRSVIVVPAAALRRVGDERYVDLLAGGNLRRHPVQTGLKDGAGLVEVVSGLTEGDRIVVSSGPE